MTTTWIICGAGRGVGKTHLSLKLCKILPNSVYAKRGCGQAKKNKPKNFFKTDKELEAFLDKCRASHTHIVAESNARARKGMGDIIVFVGGVAGRTNVRSDVQVLRSKAHLLVCPGASGRQWKRDLRKKLDDSSLREAVYNVLAEQRRYLCQSGPVIRTKSWFVVGDVRVFGSGLASLLEQVDRSGTLSRAAQETRMSYRHAWNLIKFAEKQLGKKMILPQAGGVGGGGSSLTPDGRHILQVYNQLNEEVTTYADERFAALWAEKENDRLVLAEEQSS